MSFDGLVTRAELADRLRVSVRTVDRLAVEDHEFPVPMRVGKRRVVYRSAEVDAYLRARGLTARLAARLREDARHTSRDQGFRYLTVSGMWP